jgi:hypothetical protein
MAVAPPTAANDEVKQTAPTNIVGERLRTLDPGCTTLTPCNPSGYGVFWDMALPTPPTSYIAFERYTDRTRATKAADSVLCSSFADPSCAPAENSFIVSIGVLGKCLDDAEIGCIEGLRGRVGSEAMSDLSFVEHAAATTDFAESSSLGVPRGSSVSRWRATDGTEYLLIASITSSLEPIGGSWKVLSQNVTFNIARLASSAVVTVSPPSLTMPPGYSHKVVANSNPAPDIVEFKPDTRLELGVRLPNSVTGWFNGRIAEGTVASRALSNNRTSYVIAGDAALTYVAGGAVRAEALPAGFLRELTGRDAAPGQSFGHSPGEVYAMQHLSKWEPYIGDKALATQTRWTVNASSWTRSGCFAGGTGINALLGTNSATFDGSPPTWDSKTKSLSFKVASPHYDDKGAEAVGIYTLSLPASAVSCLYGRDKLPTYAEINVLSDKNGQQFSSVTTLAERDGWVNFSAKGFHFSQPTISIAFRDTREATAATTTTATKALPKKNKATVKVTGKKAKLTISLTKRQKVKIYRKVGRRLTLLRTMTGRAGTNSFTTSYKKGYSYVVKDSKGKTLPKK